MGNFHLKVRRNFDAPAAAVAAAPAAAAVAAAPAAAAAAPVASWASVDERSEEESVDEGMVYVTAPKVSLASTGLELKLPANLSSPVSCGVQRGVGTAAA